jgi:hypothetical protein
MTMQNSHLFSATIFLELMKPPVRPLDPIVGAVTLNVTYHPVRHSVIRTFGAHCHFRT